MTDHILLTAKEAADYLNLTRQTFYRQVKNEKIKAIKMGQLRFLRTDIEELNDKR